MYDIVYFLTGSVADAERIHLAANGEKSHSPATFAAAGHCTLTNRAQVTPSIPDTITGDFQESPPYSRLTVVPARQCQLVEWDRCKVLGTM